jgi:hypothetical protein
LVNEFRRRLCKGSEEASERALAYLRGENGWWRDVLAETYEGRGGQPCELFLALRDGYLNAYADGQSVMRIELRASQGGIRPRCSIHHKYLGIPGSKPPYVPVDILREGDGAYSREKLKLWISRALEHRTNEKSGIALILANHRNVIDVEMGLPANEPTEEEAKKTAPRMDIVALEPHGDGARIAFYEAKCFRNPELRSSTGRPKVLTQLRRYEAYLSAEDRRQQVISAYRGTCSVLDQFATIGCTSAGDLVQRVAREPTFPLDLDPKPRLVIFDYDEKQERDLRWAAHKAVLSDYPILMCGRPEDIRLDV